METTNCVQKISCRYTSLDIPNDVLTFRCWIIRKYIDQDVPYLECDWEVMNPREKQTVKGSVVLRV
jgi:hypothetical protein